MEPGAAIVGMTFLTRVTDVVLPDHSWRRFQWQCTSAPFLPLIATKLNLIVDMACSAA
jgi:hypothetical protein